MIMRFKKIFVILTCLFLTQISAASAQNTICDSVGALAESIMEVRQQGVPMRYAMDVVRTNDVGPAYRHFTAGLVRTAYKYPVYRSKRERIRAIRYFRDTALSACYDQ